MSVMEASFKYAPSSLHLAPPRPFSRWPLRPCPLRSRRLFNPKASIRPPPYGFDYQAEVLQDSRSAVTAAHPELMDLVEDGSLVLIEKGRFGPVPSWRSEFVEPEVIWLIGTSHLSRKSASDVERVARAVRPDNVVVELCRGRAGIMYASTTEDASLKSNMFSLSGSKFFGAISRSINLVNATTGGQSALALRLLLAIFSSKISSGANRSFGDEFRAARKVSEDIGAQIVLGDRPIEITLERAWSSLNWSEKLRLVMSLFRGISSSSSELPESDMKNQGMYGSPYKLYESLSASYPSLLQPLVHERDTYLAWSLKRSKAVNKSKKVLGVIGKGHMNGVVFALISDQGDLRFRDLAGEKSGRTYKNRWQADLLRSLLRDTILGFILWLLYEQLKTTL
ncbi:traB domain-containing protein-like isoform X1 [Zingiber officinale]|uniref:traB domain-containing protein-like isoform X1 n=1 Tax=Zingiber officinale TaxID=94328 RepID=UPI001C4DC52C|nr:traB domain-containing protein-like isoform X1 [Zingiber officinale]